LFFFFCLFANNQQHDYQLVIFVARPLCYHLFYYIFFDG
jgi:hypothetical protein